MCTLFSVYKQVMTMSEKTKVLLVGGTHGNELTGVHLLQRWQAAPDELVRPNLTVTTLFANTAAWQANRRYLDADLNRQFAQSDLQNETITHQEGRLAKSIAAQIGPKDQPKHDFIIDLHTTTANMGITLVLNSDCAWALRAAAYVQQHMAGVVVMSKTTDRMEDTFLISMGCQRGIIVEVGPVPQGVLNGQVFEDTRIAVGHLLDYLSTMAQNRSLPDTINAYEFEAKVTYPVDDTGAIIGMIHPALQNRDYHPISVGDPVFLVQTGEVISYNGASGLVGGFINEAAYYDQAHAFSLLRPVVLKVL